MGVGRIANVGLAIVGLALDKLAWREDSTDWGNRRQTFNVLRIFLDGGLPAASRCSRCRLRRSATPPSP
jgi:hypothetical protein